LPMAMLRSTIYDAVALGEFQKRPAGSAFGGFHSKPLLLNRISDRGAFSGMLILHLSDIHFRHPICNTDRDPDRPFRTRLMQDARERVKALGPVDQGNRVKKFVTMG